MTLTRAVSASSVIGDKVVNIQGEDLGEIKEIMIDMPTGRIAYAVLSFGGFLGLGDKYFAIPWARLAQGEDHVMILDVDKELLKEAEGFDKDNWPDTNDTNWAKRTHDHYGTPYYWQ